MKWKDFCLVCNDGEFLGRVGDVVGSWGYTAAGENWHKGFPTAEVAMKVCEAHVKALQEHEMGGFHWEGAYLKDSDGEQVGYVASECYFTFHSDRYPSKTEARAALLAEAKRMKGER